MAMNAESDIAHLGDELVKAYHNQLALYDISYQVRHLYNLMEGPDSIIEHPISDGLRAFIGRTAELAEAFRSYEQEIEQMYQDAGWRYAAAAHGVHKGDRIGFTYWNGQPVVGIAQSVSLHGREVAELSLRALLLKKDGKPGKRDGYVQLAAKGWRNLESGSQSQTI